MAEEKFQVKSVESIIEKIWRCKQFASTGGKGKARAGCTIDKGPGRILWRGVGRTDVG